MTEANGERRALLIGVGRYDKKDELPALHTPTGDIAGLARVLRDSKRGRFTDVRELPDPDSQQLNESVENLFASAGPEDLVLVYFSGHGKLSPRGGLHLCATNTNSKTPGATSLALAQLNQYASNNPIAQVVLVLDCCFSGAADLGFKGDLPSLVTSDLGQGQGKYVITSSSALQVSRARPGERYSVFTKWLIEGLETGAPDLDENQAITIEELFRYVKEKMAKDEPSQVPQSYTWSIKPGDVIIGYSQRAPKTTTGATLASTHPVFFKALEPLLPQKKVIPFLGSGIYGSGPLSPFRLSTALAELGQLAGQWDLATSAEYLEKFYDDREQFIQVFSNVLSEQSTSLARNAIHDFVRSVPRPPLVISATYDLLLERHLEAEGIPYTLLTHILRSRDGRDDGKVLVVRRGPTPSVDIMAADAFILPHAPELTVYKVLGTPFLAEFAGAEADLDTVVVTEGDHLTFVSRLENERTGVPAAFSIPLQEARLLFLGYSLDIWHYRLVLRVFGQNRARLKKSYAVRQPATQMEDLYWQRLGSNMIKADPEQFAELFVTPRLVGAA